LKTEIEDQFRNYEKTITTLEERELFEKARPLCRHYIEIVESQVPLSRKGKGAEAQAAYLQQADPVHAEAKKVLRSLIDLKQERGKTDAAAELAAGARGSAATGC
jgi:CHASE3 domain sensor protein